MARHPSLVRPFVAGASVPPGISHLGSINHIAIATKNAVAAAAFYRDVLGATDISPPLGKSAVALPDHGVSTIFVNLGETKIEILEPLGAKSPIAQFLAKNPAGGIHHICINVEGELDAAIRRVVSSGVRVLGEPKIGAHGKRVVFLHPKDCGGVLIELEEC
ncbi:Methylmalonyl-CoA epimerase, mitochondrial [Smittium mucronatum]|uniref:Methylmalonyl-CoA epimerase, mitochondrial n=1 Tax=Smittium mucronatum TaxID=133383 RepID=A0A1R0H260_9FUNG|nr:Methylmalonyl-CoA epimerase, mitochondrial [Smittium mucronatum]